MEFLHLDDVCGQRVAILCKYQSGIEAVFGTLDLLQSDKCRPIGVSPDTRPGTLEYQPGARQA